MNKTGTIGSLKKRNKQDTLFASALLLPTFIIFGIVVFFPIIKGIVVSFCDYRLATLNNPVWNNFENYKKIFKHGQILVYFKNTFIYVFFIVVIKFSIGMGIALLINANVKGRKLIRGLYLVPWTIPSVVVAILWKWMFQQQFGVLNYILYHLKLTSTINISWFQDSTLAYVSVIIAVLWRQLPYVIVMLLAGLQSVDKSLIEQATIEGACSRQVFRHVTIPAILPVITTTVWISIMDNFQMFTIIFNMTGGGPLESTTTLSIAAYKKAFMAYDFGQGSAIGVMWMLVLIIATVIYNKMNSKYTVNYM